MALSTIKVPGSEALATLDARRAAYPTTGEYAFLIGGPQEAEFLREGQEGNDQDPSEVIQTALALDPVQWITQHRAETVADYEEYELSEDDVFGEWPGEVEEKGQISLHTDILSGKVQPEVYLGLVPLEEPWQLPAVLRWGGWNDCPMPEVHCAMHRMWHRDCGAEIVGMSGDIIECAVSRPPRDREAAIALAWQQYWYCSDIVNQGCDTVGQLAATLLNSPYWFFWWD